MDLEAYRGKAVIEIDFLTNFGEKEATRKFNNWIQTAKQHALDVTVKLEPVFYKMEKDDVEKD